MSCASCCLISTIVFLSIIIIYLIGCAFLQVPYWNRTIVTHAIPNTWDMASYLIEGRPRIQIPFVGTYENGTKFAEYESLIDRMRRRTNSSSFVPPKQLVALEENTFDMDRTKLHKFDSVPPILRDVALPRLSSHTRESNIIHNSGSSIFVTNYDDRGEDNEMKRKYMAGLTGDDIIDYVQRCTPAMYDALYCMGNKTQSPHRCIFDAVKRITFIVHTHLEPEQVDKEFIETGAGGFSAVSQVNSLADSVFMPEITQMHILKHDGYIKRLKEKLEDGSFSGLFKSLKDNDYREADILVEYLHNILALTLQWTILMEELVNVTTSSVQANEIYIYNHIKKHPTAAFVISSKSIDASLPKDLKADTHVVHAMKEIMAHHPQSVNIANAKNCPHYEKWSKSPEGATIVSGTHIIEEEGNWGFGRGYRRCSGEVLTIEMMKKWIEIIHMVDYTYVLGERNATFGFGYEYDSTFTVHTRR